MPGIDGVLGFGLNAGVVDGPGMGEVWEVGAAETAVVPPAAGGTTIMSEVVRALRPGDCCLYRWVVRRTVVGIRDQAR